MKNKFTFISKLLSLFLLLGTMNLFAQPANDLCSGATPMTLAADEASCTWVDADTRETVSAIGVTAPSVCSAGWYADDVWFSFETGATVPTSGIVVKTEYGSQTDDVQTLGMAFYYSCDPSEDPFLICFSDPDGVIKDFSIQSSCLEANHTYIVRMWSGLSGLDNTGTFRICAFENPAPIPVEVSPVLWTDDFSGGMGGWTTTTTTDTTDIWRLAEDGFLEDVSGSRSYAINNPFSSCTPAMGFAAAWFQSNMTGNSDSVFALPSTAYEKYTSELISPSIDLTGITAGVSVKFDQAVRVLNNNAGNPTPPITSVSFSIDGGSNWSTPVEVNAEMEANDPTKNSIVRVPLPNAEGNADVRVKFIWQGDFYFWMIDRVQIIEREAHNMRANPFYAIAPNKLTPKTQTDSVFFLVDVENVGDLDQTNVNVNMTITNSAGTPVFNDNLDYGTVASLAVDENRIFPNTYLPPAAEDTYDAVYTVSADSTDFDLSDNTQRFSFAVSDSTFAKEDGTGIFGVTTPASETALTWSMATSYFVRNGEDPNNAEIKYECSSVLIGLNQATTNAGGVVSVYLYEWEDVNKDGTSQLTERGAGDAVGGAIIGNFIYTLDGTESDLLINLDNFEDDGEPILLKANTLYVLSVGLTPSSTSTTKIRVTGNDNQIYDATDFLTDSITVGRISSMWNTSEGDAGYNSDLTQVGFSPRLRMHVTPYMITSVNTPLDEANKVTVFPNPATDEISLKLDLVENMEKAVIRIVDLNAHNVMEKTYDNLSSQTLTFPVSDLAAGVYFVKIQSDKGYSIQKFTIIK